ncbi:hypothetical protein TSOC_009576 [Tetrabaena socialis]|uniref:Uncharacterized protein n=1 Tax=Tetrabaena socialis TaxID=47790 RepID=A0A2J7ZVK6_9CHLO|nr:hypothetical protein TSOC_009576 [Tetrabaena socialis]|eukprot:PNH04290.1 hypothetical protein TSOC_009576 [Tetrabaena socialis]
MSDVEDLTAEEVAEEGDDGPLEAQLEDVDTELREGPCTESVSRFGRLTSGPEESIWTFLCEAQLVGFEQARKQFLEVGRDSRPVMRAAYECFRTGATPDTIMAQVADNGGHDTFYGLLYVGLWEEAHGDAAAARKAITSAVQTQYAQRSGDYMASLARVHCLRRGWPTEA